MTIILNGNGALYFLYGINYFFFAYFSFLKGKVVGLCYYLALSVLCCLYIFHLKFEPNDQASQDLL